MGSVFKIEIKFRLGEKEDLDDIMKIFQSIFLTDPSGDITAT